MKAGIDIDDDTTGFFLYKIRYKIIPIDQISENLPPL